MASPCSRGHKGGQSQDFLPRAQPVLRRRCTHRTSRTCHVGSQKVRSQVWSLEGGPDFRATSEGWRHLSRAPRAVQGGLEGADTGRAVEGEEPAGAEAEQQEMKSERERSKWWSLWGLVKAHSGK